MHNHHCSLIHFLPYSTSPLHHNKFETWKEGTDPNSEKLESSEWEWEGWLLQELGKPMKKMTTSKSELGCFLIRFILNGSHVIVITFSRCKDKMYHALP